MGERRHLRNGDIEFQVGPIEAGVDDVVRVDVESRCNTLIKERTSPGALRALTHHRPLVSTGVCAVLT